MKALSIAVALSAVALSGTALATSGFLDSCSNFTLRDLNGVKGRSPLLGASCRVAARNTMAWSQLDLNACFGWSYEDCSFVFPPSSGFTNAVTGCNNTFYGGDMHFGENFGCYGPCVEGGTDECYSVFRLSKCSASSSLSSSPCQNLTHILTDEFIGNNNGKLVC
jgi:hypothetical protein